MIAGPYVKAGHVSSVTLEHSSVLRHIEKHFDLEPCNARTAAATDLTDALDLEALAAGTPRAPAAIPAVDFDGSTLGAECLTRLKPAHDLFRIADEHPALFRGYDRRDRIVDTVYEIGDYLERHGVGGIRRGGHRAALRGAGGNGSRCTVSVRRNPSGRTLQA